MNQAANSGAFSKTAPYYDAMYGARRIKSDVRAITRHLRSNLPSIKHPTLLNVGCGTGAHDLDFFRAGFKITGIDKSQEMISIAIKKAFAENAAIQYIAQDILSYSSLVQYDTVISLFDVLSYMTTNDQIKRFFTNISSLLRPKGVFIVDCWYGPGIIHSKVSTKKQIYQTHGFKITRTKKPSISKKNRTITVHHSLQIRQPRKGMFTITEDHALRYFSYQEIARYAKWAGLVILSWGVLGFPMRPPIPPPRSVYFIMQKEKSMILPFSSPVQEGRK